MRFLAEPGIPKCLLLFREQNISDWADSSAGKTCTLSVMKTYGGANSNIYILWKKLPFNFPFSRNMLQSLRKVLQNV